MVWKTPKSFNSQFISFDCRSLYTDTFHWLSTLWRQIKRIKVTGTHWCTAREKTETTNETVGVNKRSIIRSRVCKIGGKFVDMAIAVNLHIVQFIYLTELLIDLFILHKKPIKCGTRIFMIGSARSILWIVQCLFSVQWLSFFFIFFLLSKATERNSARNHWPFMKRQSYNSEAQASSLI